MTDCENIKLTLNSEQYELLNYFEQFWFESGSLPTKEFCTDNGLPAALYNKCVGSPEFRTALLARGINLSSLQPIEGESQFMGGKALTERQLTVANVMLDLHDQKSQKKKLQELGVSSGEYTSWLRDPSFQNYLRIRAEHVLGDNQHEANFSLVDRVRTGDVNAIKYFNELTGYYRPNQTSQVDVKLILVKVMEAIQRHVSNPTEQELIADELLSLASGLQVANSLTQTPVNSAPVGRLSGIGTGNLSGDF